MPLKNVTVGALALVGGVIGGALSGGVFSATRAEAAPRGGVLNPPAPLNPNDTTGKPPTALNPSFLPTVMTLPVGGLVFKSADGKVLAKLHTHDGGALFSVYNSAGMVVASIGADEQTMGGRLSLTTPSGGGCFIGLGTTEGGRLDLYHPQVATPRVTLQSNDAGRFGSLLLRDIRPLGMSLLPNDIYNLHLPR